MTASAPRIVVLTGADPDLPPPDLAALEAEATISVAVPGEHARVVATADVVLVWDTTFPDVDGVLLGATGASWIYVAAAGLDAVLSPRVRHLTATLTTAAGIQDEDIAEFVVAAALSRVKELDLAAAQQGDRLWREISVRRLAGSTCLVIGCGGIGRATARKLRALGVHVRGAGRNTRRDDPDFERVVSSTEMTSELGWADLVVVAAPLTARTAGIVDAAALAAMKSDAHLVNVARGGCVVEADLVDAVRRGVIGAATLDVTVEEPLSRDSPLWTVPGIRVNPHSSGNTPDLLDGFRDRFVGDFDRWKAGTLAGKSVADHVREIWGRLGESNPRPSHYE